MSDDPISVFIVDDHPIVRAGLRAMLDREGFAIVAELASAAEAIEAARRFAPNVVLLDCTMPGMTGAQATRALLRVAAATSVVLLVTFESEREIARGLEAGASLAIAKESSRAEIIAAVWAAGAASAARAAGSGRRC